MQTLILSDKKVVDDQGDEYHFEKLLLATGGSPITLPFGKDDIIYFRDLNDYRTLRTLADKKQRFAVIGGGFIGSEISAALAMNGKQVMIIFPEEGIGARLFPHDLNQFLNRYYRDKGVEIYPGQLLTGVSRRQSQVVLHLRNVEGNETCEIEVDTVVAGIGILPNVGLAEQAGLPIDNGIVVDDRLRIGGNPDVFAAGDVANVYNPSLAARIRMEHEDNALTMGKYAGRNMAGEVLSYHHLPYFYSDMFELEYEAVGRTDSRLNTVADWVEPYRQGVVYYLQDSRVRGVLLWNVWDRVDTARALIAESGTYSPAVLKGRLLP